jgi:DNA-binding NarL/FixJ family response regulator
MEFRREEFIEREKEIAQCLLQGSTIKQIALRTGLSRRHVAAHVRNMITKMKAEDLASLINLLKSQERMN